MTAGSLGRPLRLVAIAPHPIQYHAPLFRRLALDASLDFEVAYLRIPDDVEQGRGFGVPFRWDIPLLDGYRWRVLDTVTLAGGSGFFGRRLVDVESQLGALNADALFVTGWQNFPLLQVLRAASRRRVPVVMRGESNGLRGRRLLAGPWHTYILSACDAFLVIGTANRSFYRENGIPDSRMFDAPYCVDNDYFSGGAAALRESRLVIREEMGVPRDAVCFLFAGKLEEKKHPDHVLRALAAARAGGGARNGHVLMVGTGALHGRLAATVADQRLPVSFAGFLNQSEMSRAYVAADVLVLPSDHGETWGLVVNEAMACGLPAIVSDRVGCGPDLVMPGVTGDVYPFGDIDALRQLLVSGCEQPERLRSMGLAAAKRVFSEFTIERSAAAAGRAARYAVDRRRSIGGGAGFPATE